MSKILNWHKKVINFPHRNVLSISEPKTGHKREF